MITDNHDAKIFCSLGSEETQVRDFKDDLLFSSCVKDIQFYKTVLHIFVAGTRCHIARQYKTRISFPVINPSTKYNDLW